MTFSQQLIVYSGVAALSYFGIMLYMERKQLHDYRHLLTTIYSYFLAGVTLALCHMVEDVGLFHVNNTVIYLLASGVVLAVIAATLLMMRRYRVREFIQSTLYSRLLIIGPFVVVALIYVSPISFYKSLMIIGSLGIAGALYARHMNTDNQSSATALLQGIMSLVLVLAGQLGAHFDVLGFYVVVFGVINGLTLLIISYVLERRWVEEESRSQEHERALGKLSVTKQALNRLRVLHESTKSMMANGYWEYDPKEDHLHISEEMAVSMGISETQFQNTYKRWLNNIVPEDRDPKKNPMVEWLRNPEGFQEALKADSNAVSHLVAEYRYMTKSSGVKWVRNRVSYNRDAGRFMGTLEIIQEYKEVQERMELLRYYDGLTGLPNKKRLYEDYEKVSELDQHALFILDVDYFQRVNDTIGHDAGDLMLRRVAAFLKESGMEPYRLGGDEFAAIIPLEGACNLLTGLNCEAAPASFSLGATQLTQDMSTSEALRQADLALYHAKKQGRRRTIWFEKDFDRALRKRIEYEYMLESDQLEQQLDVAFQPKVRLDDLHVIEVEALIRWRIGNKYVSPAEFLPVAEENGAIHRIGKFVLKKGIEWLRDHPGGPRVSVNISAKQLEDDTCVNWMIEELKQSGVPGNRLTIELTESVLVNSFSQSQALLKRMRDAGIRIALDDFGTGYSSLSYLLQLPIDELKLDKSFIDLISQNDRSLRLVSGIQSMVDGIGIELVVEGVETSEQADILKQLRIAYIQGYWFSKPLFQDELDAFLSPSNMNMQYEVVS